MIVFQKANVSRKLEQDCLCCLQERLLRNVDYCAMRRGMLAQKTQNYSVQAFGRARSRSRQLYERALGSLAGGNARSSTFFPPYPLFVDRAESCRFHDVDGNVYLDPLNNFTSLVHGHGHGHGHPHPHITAVVGEQAAKDTVYAAPAEVQLELTPVPVEPCRRAAVG